MQGILRIILLTVLLGAVCVAEEPAPRKLTEVASGPWWMQETAMTAKGALRLDEKSWWEQAQGLEIGESFAVDEGRALVRRETFEDRSGRPQDAIVWVLDDDGDGSLADGGDTDSDCYVADYGRDGIVDRMVDYIDNDGDGDPDEMDIRYFVDGELRYCWFGADYDDDSAMWSLRGYEYGGPSFFESDPHGDNMIYMNKLDTDTGTWSPISECPFAFYDTDEDGYSEIAIRCSAVPLSYDPNADPDYANDYGNFAAPWNPALARMGIVNLRYSFDIDGGSSTETPLHYDFGFNLVGAEPYDYPGMKHFNPKRRPPQVTIVTPFKDLRSISDTYPARETGFSWHEQADDTISIGYGDDAGDDQRWEGVFWTWERRFMENTGGPNQKWNVRREYSDAPADKRELYYSAIDKRIHLKGAREGWIQVGHFNGLGELGEIRMFDTDGNGYFDRWEYDIGEHRRIVTVSDERAEDLPWDLEGLSRRYMEEILPEAVVANRQLKEAMATVYSYEPNPALAEAANGETSGWQRYAQDILREMHYEGFREYLGTIIERRAGTFAPDDLRTLDAEARKRSVNSQTNWELQRLLTEIDHHYRHGYYEKAKNMIEALAGLLERL